MSYIRSTNAYYSSEKKNQINVLQLNKKHAKELESVTSILINSMSKTVLHSKEWKDSISLWESKLDYIWEYFLTNKDCEDELISVKSGSSEWNVIYERWKSKMDILINNLFFHELPISVMQVDVFYSIGIQ